MTFSHGIIPFATKQDLIEKTFSHGIFPNNFLNMFRELTTKFKAENLVSIQFQVQLLAFMNSSL